LDDTDLDLSATGGPHLVEKSAGVLSGCGLRPN
jgi:hypothetical protein